MRIYLRSTVGANRTGFLARLLAVILAGPLFAQQQRPPVAYRFDHLTVNDGLSASNVYAMIQDRHGFLWFGTYSEGLNKYDGYGFTVYKHNPFDTTSISGNSIRSITESPDGTLWVGTACCGLNHFDPATERFTRYRHDPDNAATLSNDLVIATHVDRAGRVWVSSVEEQQRAIPQQRDRYPTTLYLDRLDPKTGVVTRYPHGPVDLLTWGPRGLMPFLIYQHLRRTTLAVQGRDAFLPAFRHHVLSI